MGIDLILQALAVNLVTWFEKRFFVISENWRDTILPVSAAIFSYLAVLTTSAITGEPLDPVHAETLVSAVYAFISSQGTYLLMGKIKK